MWSNWGPKSLCLLLSGLPPKLGQFASETNAAPGQMFSRLLTGNGKVGKSVVRCAHKPSVRVGWSFQSSFQAEQNKRLCSSMGRGAHPENGRLQTNKKGCQVSLSTFYALTTFHSTFFNRKNSSSIIEIKVQTSKRYSQQHKIPHSPLYMSPTPPPSLSRRLLISAVSLFSSIQKF